MRNKEQAQMLADQILDSKRTNLTAGPAGIMTANPHETYQTEDSNRNGKSNRYLLTNCVSFLGFDIR